MTHKNIEQTVQKVTFSNEKSSIKFICVEPWAEEITVEAAQKIALIGVGPSQGAQLDIEFSDGGLFVYAWRGAMIEVWIDGVLAETASAKFPSF